MSAEATIRVILFSGLKRDWTTWKAKFLTRANKKEIREVFENMNEDLTITGPDEVTSGATAEEVSEYEAKKALAKANLKKNNEAFDDLLLSMDTSNMSGTVAFRIVDRARTRAGLGIARQAWRNLNKRYEPRTTPNRAKLQMQFFGAKCSDNQDPEGYVSYMEDLRNHLEEAGGEPIKDDQFMTQVLNTLPSTYGDLVERLEERVGHMDVQIRLTIEEMTEKLALRYERTFRRREHHKKEDVALVASQQFKGKCNHCGKYGHKAVNCRERNRVPKEKETAKDGKPPARFTGECFYCHKKGHRAADCFKKKADVAKGIAAMAVDSSDDEEVALMALEVQGAAMGEDSSDDEEVAPMALEVHGLMAPQELSDSGSTTETECSKESRRVNFQEDEQQDDPPGINEDQDSFDPSYEERRHWEKYVQRMIREEENPSIEGDDDDISSHLSPMWVSSSTSREDEEQDVSTITDVPRERIRMVLANEGAAAFWNRLRAVITVKISLKMTLKKSRLTPKQILKQSQWKKLRSFVKTNATSGKLTSTIWLGKDLI